MRKVGLILVVFLCAILCACGITTHLRQNHSHSLLWHNGTGFVYGQRFGILSGHAVKYHVGSTLNVYRDYYARHKEPAEIIKRLNDLVLIRFPHVGANDGLRSLRFADKPLDHGERCFILRWRTVLHAKHVFPGVLKANGQLRQGDSGSPIVNELGDVVGTVWGTFQRDDGHEFILFNDLSDLKNLWSSYEAQQFYR